MDRPLEHGDTVNPHPIYLDYHSTTPVDPRVVEAMLPYLTTEFGNPSSGPPTAAPPRPRSDPLAPRWPS